MSTDLVSEVLAEIAEGDPLSNGQARLLAHELRVARTALEMADRAHREQMAELGRRQLQIDLQQSEADVRDKALLDAEVQLGSAEGMIERLREVMRKSVKQRDNGHSPCNCEEIKGVLNERRYNHI